MNDEASRRRRRGQVVSVSPFPPSLVHAPEQRLMEAMLLACGELGYDRATVQDVVTRARAGRATFYKLFSDKQDCFRRAHEQVGEWICERVVATAGSGSDPREGLRLAVVEVVAVCEESPEIARAVLVGPYATGGPVLDQHHRLLNRLAATLDRCRQDPSIASPPPEAAAFTVGAIETLLRDRLMAGDRRAGAVRDLLPRLLYVAMAQYFGADAAREELGSEPRPRP